MVNGEVERASRVDVEHAVGKHERHRNRRAQRGERFRRLVRFGPAPAVQHAATHRRTLREAVDPPHRHGPRGRRRFQGLHEGVDVGDALQLLVNPGRRHANETKAHVEDVTGQPHAADGGVEEIRMLASGAGDHAAVCDSQPHRRRHAGRSSRRRGGSCRERRQRPSRQA